MDINLQLDIKLVMGYSWCNQMSIFCVQQKHMDVNLHMDM